MAAAVAGTSTKIGGTATVSITGAANNTTYFVRIVHPSGATTTLEATTNGSGAASATYVPQEAGTVTYNVDPLPATGGTTCTGTATHTH